MMWTAPRVCAQGVNGQLPDPIAAARLSAYGDLLNLSPQQRHAVDDLHAAYRAEFQKLREGEIDKWVNTVRGGPYTRGYIAKQRDLLDRIAGIDERFFDSLIPILAEPQVARLPRVRALRQRERLMQVRSLWDWNDIPAFDVTQAICELALPADQMLAIDATLATYEAALTVKLQRVVDGHFDTCSKAFDAYAGAGFTEERRADPATAEAAYAVAKPIWDAWRQRHHELMQDVVALNRQTLRALSATLPEIASRALRASFITGTYSHQGMFREMGMLAQIESPYGKTLARTDLAQDQRALLEVQATAFQKEVDATVDGMIARVETYRNTYTGEYDHEQEFKERTAIEHAGTAAWQTLMTRCNEEIERIAGIVGKGPVVEPEIPDPEKVDLFKVSLIGMFQGRTDISGWAPPAVSARDIAQYSAWLGLDAPQQQQLMMMVHQKYLEQYEPFKMKHHDAIMAASDAMYKLGTQEGYTKENLRRCRAVQAEALAAQHALEDAFFAEIAEALHLKHDDAGFQRVKLARMRQWLNRGAFASDTRQPGGRFDGLIDLSSLLSNARDLDLTRPEADRALSEYEQAIAPLLKARQDAMIAYRAVDDDLRVEWQERRVETGKDWPDMQDRNLALGVDRLRAAARKAGDAIADLNRASVERLLAILPPDSAERVRRTYDRMAWPHIYSDRSLAAPLLTAALKLGDLTAEQRNEIENIAAEYHPTYDIMCEKMKTAVEGPDCPLYANGVKVPEEQWIAYNQRRGVRQRMLFERHELNVRAWQQLRGILSEDQAKKIGLSATPPAGPGENEDFGT